MPWVENTRFPELLKILLSSKVGAEKQYGLTTYLFGNNIFIQLESSVFSHNYFLNNHLSEAWQMTMEA